MTSCIGVLLYEKDSCEKWLMFGNNVIIISRCWLLYFWGFSTTVTIRCLSNKVQVSVLGFFKIIGMCSCRLICFFNLPPSRSMGMEKWFGETNQCRPTTIGCIKLNISRTEYWNTFTVQCAMYCESMQPHHAVILQLSIHVAHFYETLWLGTPTVNSRMQVPFRASVQYLTSIKWRAFKNVLNSGFKKHGIHSIWHNDHFVLRS